MTEPIEDPEQIAAEFAEMAYTGVHCPNCTWFGTADECRYSQCPNCRTRVKLDKEPNESSGLLL